MAVRKGFPHLALQRLFDLVQTGAQS